MVGILALLGVMGHLLFLVLVLDCLICILFLEFVFVYVHGRGLGNFGCNLGSRTVVLLILVPLFLT